MPVRRHHGSVRSATWLAPELVAAVVELGPTRAEPAFRWEGGDDGAARALSLGGDHWLVTLASPLGAGLNGSPRLTWEDGARRRVLAPGELAEVTRDAKEFAGEGLRGVDGETRARAVDFLARAPAAHHVELSRSLADRLAGIHDLLRDEPPPSPIKRGTAHALRLDAVLAIDDTAFWLSGWLHDSDPEQAELTCVTPEGLSVALHAPALSFHPRRDVDRMFAELHPNPNRGFHAYVELDRPSASCERWVVRARSRDGEEFEDVARGPARYDPAATRARAMHVMRLETVTDELIEGQVLPALCRLRASEVVEVETVEDFGDVAPAPAFSLVIPLRRADRVEHQLVQFARDHELTRAEVTFVIPPSLGPVIRRRGQDWSDLLGVPFRVATLSAEVSRARAFNLGSAIARADTLVLMQGDVFPVAAGWLGRLQKRLRSRSQIGAVAPRLLFSDGSLAHAETRYEPDEAGDGWTPTIPWRGLSAALPATRGPRRVHALCDAVVMMRAEHFHRVGGFSDDYHDGVEEAADLCFRLAREGLESWVADTDMYLLERTASWPSPAGPGITRLNRWLFARRWGASLPAPRPQVSAPRRDTPVEILGVVGLGAPDGARIAGFELTRPAPGDELECYAGTYAFTVKGWVIARDDRPLRIQAREGDRALFETPAVEACAPATGRAGFQAVVGALDLPLEFGVEVVAVAPDGQHTPLARISGRRRPVRSSFVPSVHPVVVTTLGRSGSSWLTLLLSQHPEVMAYRPFQNDARVAAYWVAVLRSLAEPASYVQALRPEYYAGHWWLGDQRPSPVPLQLAEPHMPQWLGDASVEVLATFCHSRIDAFYAELARVEGRARPRYFAEKSWPDGASLGVLGELYPDGRELLLVRDFRDMVCSIIAFNAKRGFPSFGREVTDSDEAMIRLLRDHALQMLDGVRRRGDRALVVRYEDLVLHPERTLAGIFSHLGVEAGGAVTRETIARAARVLPEVQRAHQTSASVTASIGRWRDELSSEHMTACAENFDDLLAAFGYEPTL